MADTEKDEIIAKQLRAGGHIASLAILVLALFAFGLERKEKGNHLDVKWSEVPAILIVFVLAELGVELVVNAQLLRGKVEKAASTVSELTRQSDETARRVGDVAGRVLDELNAVDTTVNKSVRDLLTTVQQLTGSVPLLESGMKFALQTGDVNVWRALATFADAWHVTDEKSDPQSRNLVGKFFETFIGEPDSMATVRRNRKEESITCATIDSVFAEISKALLIESDKKGEQFIVWAVTALHPFEFCLPDVFWAPDDQPTRRVTALKGFVQTVKEQCAKKGDTLAEYRRLTVFTKEATTALPGVKERPIESEDQLLDAWYIWTPDQALLKLPTPHSAHTVTAWLLTTYGSSAASRVFTGDDLRKLAATQQNPNKVHSLPVAPDSGKVTPYQLGSELAAAFIPKNSKPAITTEEAHSAICVALHVPASAPPANIDEVLRAAGWLTIREWYRSTLHKPLSTTEPAARHAVIDEQLPTLSAFEIELDDRKWKTLDLILIGTNTEDSKRRWFAAILSDIDFDNPACVVKFIFGRQELARIGDGVATLWDTGTEW